jgi:beta-glucosidase-like glycosyl hydrolase
VPLFLKRHCDRTLGGVEWKNLSRAIDQVLATETRLDEAVRRSFKPQFDVGRFDPPDASEWNALGLESLNSSEHRQISYDAALQSLVLLRNDGTALPLRVGSRVAVVGPQSTARGALLSDYAGGQWCYGASNKHPWSQQEYCIPSIAEGIAAANAGGATSVAAGVSTCTATQPSPKCKEGVSQWNQ